MSSTKFVFFGADRKNKMAALASDWLRHYRLFLWNRWTEFNKNLTGSKISKSSTKFVFFGPVEKTRWPPWPLIGWEIYNFSSETAERNSRKLNRKQDLNVLYQGCVFRADRKNKMAALASDWLRHFRLLLWNRGTEFKETWQEAWSQRPLPSFCFLGRSEKQDGRPGLWLAETFSTSPLKPLNGIRGNSTGSKISMSSSKFVFFELVGKTRWPPWPLIGWDIFDFLSETAVQNWPKLDRKQDLKVLYQVCVFWAGRKNKMAALASDWLRHFRLLLWNRWTEFNETWQEARSQSPLPSLCFSGRSEKQDGRPGLWLAETFLTSPLKLLNGIQRNLTGNNISKSSTKFVFFGQFGKTRWPPWPLIGWDIFDFSSETVERNSTKLDRKQDLNVLYQVCVFRADRKNKMAALASDWLRHYWLFLWNRWTEFNKTWQEARSQSPLPSLCFLGRSKKQDGRPGLWLAEKFTTSPLKPLNGIQENSTGSKISTSSTKVVFFGPIGKTRWPPWPLIGWDIFDFYSETAERNSRKLDRKHDLNVLYQVFVFWADRKNKMAALASDWLRHFRLLLWNHWTEFEETQQEARSQCPLPSLCFSSWSEKQDGRPGLWLAETFSTSCLKPLYRIDRNLTGSKISKSSTKFVFFGPVGKTRWPPWPLIGWDIFDFSSETAERNSTKLDRKQDLKVLYQVCVFRVDQKNKMAALASDWLRHFWLLLWNCWTEFNETWQETISQSPLPSLCFSVSSEKQDGRPGLWLAETFSTFPLKLLNGIQQNLTGSKISTSSTKFVFFGLISKQMSALADSSKRWHIVLRCTICGPLGLLFEFSIGVWACVLRLSKISYFSSYIMFRAFSYSFGNMARGAWIWNFTEFCSKLVIFNKV